MIEETIAMTKRGYRDSLKELEKISEEIREMLDGRTDGAGASEKGATGIGRLSPRDFSHIAGVDSPTANGNWGQLVGGES